MHSRFTARTGFSSLFHRRRRGPRLDAVWYICGGTVSGQTEREGKGMRKTFVAVLTAVIVGAPLATAASADEPFIQPIRCRIGDETGIYVGGKCPPPYPT